MNKICTSIEQSQKLLELGIDVNTADMMWDDWNLIDEGWKLSVGYYPEIEKDYGRKCYPAWSLAALLDLIPDIIEDYVLRIDKVDGEYFIWYDKISEGWSDAIAHPSSENFIDAAFEMICWLKENGKI